jgi:protein tyrosine phosphatase type 4A
MAAVANKPSLIEWKQYRFLIMDAPKSSNLEMYIKELRKSNVTDLVRACGQTYDGEEIERAGIKMHVRTFLCALLLFIICDINTKYRFLHLARARS